MSSKNETIADLMMGAAHADDKLDGREYETVKQLLAKMMDLEAIPEEMIARIDGFKADGFDPAGAARSLGLEDEEEKRKLMELLSAVTEADEELDLDESDYLESVANALDLPRATFTDLTIEILEVENLKQAGKKLIKPPPIPEAAKK